MILSSALQAAGQAGAATTDSVVGAGELVQTILALLLVLAMIFALAWALRRVRLGAGVGRDCRVIRNLPLGQRERVVVVEIAGEQWILGVTPHNVSTIGRPGQPLGDGFEGKDSNSNFGQLLKRLTERGGGSQ